MTTSHYNRIQNAINFIETNLHQSFTLIDVSKTAFSSLSYFHRIFYFMTGLTVKEYIRKRRLSEAAYQLRCTKLSITEIGLNACYETPESFTRAFRKYYNMSPRQFRNTKQEQTLFNKLDVINTYALDPEPKLDFNLNMDYVIYKESVISGFLTQTTIENDQQTIDICNFANDIITTGKLSHHFNLSKSPIFGIYTNMTDQNEFDYTIGCLEESCLKHTKELVTHIIPNSRYARFSFERQDRIKEAWHYIYGYWLPQNEDFRTPGFDFEIYLPDRIQIYIPMNILP